MEKMTDLQDLLKHEIKDLYSAEEQIIQAMPRMIEKVSNPQLRQALEMHLRVTEGQVKRLQQVQQLMAQGGAQESGGDGQGNNGLFARLTRRRSQSGDTGSGGEKCLGMEGLLREGEKVLAEEMESSVLDAAIIACAQKIEHYEICGYGTARAYARELNMGEVAELLEQTLDEEYEADDRLTDMAVGRLNEEAERGGRSRSSASSSAGRSSSRSAASKSTSRSRSGAAVAASNSRSGSSSSGRGSSGSSRSTAASNRGGSSSGRNASASTGRSASSSSGRSASASSSRSGGTSKAASKTSSTRSSSPAPASKTSSSRTASKGNGRSSGASGNTRTAANSRSGKAPSKAAAAKGGRNSSGGGRTASKSTGRGSSSGRSSGRR